MVVVVVVERDNFVKHLIDTMKRKRQPDTIPSQN